MLLINSEVELTLFWFKNCVLINKSTRDANYNEPIDRKIDNPEDATFQITDTKSYVPVVTLSTKDDNNFLEQLKSGFKRTIKWNKDRSEMTKTNHLNHLIDPTFTNVNRLDKRQDMSRDRTYFSKYYVPKFEIKDFNVLIDGKPFLMWQ